MFKTEAGICKSVQAFFKSEVGICKIIQVFCEIGVGICKTVHGICKSEGRFRKFPILFCSIGVVSEAIVFPADTW